MSETSPAQRYGPSSGLVLGVVGLAVCALVLGLVVDAGLSAGSARVGIATLGAAVLIWAYLLRPRIIVEAGGATLHLRNPLTSWRIPLAAVRDVEVKTFTIVTTDDASYEAVAVGYSLRTVVRASRPPSSGFLMPSLRGRDGRGSEETTTPRRKDQAEQKVMVQRVLAAADRARVLGLVGPPAQRSRAVLELALLGICVVAFVGTFLG